MSDTTVVIDHFIGARAVPDGDRRLSIANPVDGSPLAEFPAAGAATVAGAVAAAVGAQDAWNSLTIDERSAQLLLAAERVADAAEELAQLDVRETGKPTALARALAASAEVHLRDFVAAATRLDERLDGGHRQRRDPYGVVAMIVPWNAPVEVVMRTLPAIVVMGNTLVIKPSERAPLAVRRLIEVLGLPAGVVNVVLGGPETGEALVADQRVDLVVHTGSVESGRAIAVESARHLRPVLLELGGKDAVIVDRDVDIAWAAQLVAQGSFINAGQLCTAIERIYVLEEIAEAFTVELVRLAEAERIGPGTDPAPTMGPLIDDRHRRLVHAHVCDALERGATLRTGGEIPDGPGFHYPPTVLVGCDAHMAVMADETFGPVAAVQAVPDLDHAVREANGGRYGLAATVLSNRAEGMEAARRLTVGTVWVNTYLVGTEGASCQPRGDSGLGAVGDRNAVLRAVSSPTTMHIATGPSGPRTGAERSVEVTEHAKEPS